jgi:hypothetical protein
MLPLSAWPIPSSAGLSSPSSGRLIMIGAQTTVQTLLNSTTLQKSTFRGHVYCHGANMTRGTESDVFVCSGTPGVACGSMSSGLAAGPCPTSTPAS